MGRMSIKNIEIQLGLAELKRLRIVDKKLSKIIKVMGAWHTHYAPDRAHTTLNEIAEIIDEEDDPNVS